jgi:hypothetical protein
VLYFKIIAVIFPRDTLLRCGNAPAGAFPRRRTHLLPEIDTGDIFFGNSHAGRLHFVPNTAILSLNH